MRSSSLYSNLRCLPLDNDDALLLDLMIYELHPSQRG
jgi:hypothetical protein